MRKDIVVEKGIPIPPRGETGISAALRGMEVTDSIELDSRSQSTVYQYAIRAGIKIVTRKKDNRVRVWRIA